MPGNTSKRYPAELKARAVRMYHECRPDQATDWAATGHVANLLGIATAETLRKWVRQDEIDQGSRPGLSSEESAEIKPVSYTHLRAHETVLDLVCRLLLEK